MAFILAHRCIYALTWVSIGLTIPNPALRWQILDSERPPDVEVSYDCMNKQFLQLIEDRGPTGGVSY